MTAFDTDKDGTLTPEEMTTGMQAELKTYDTDANGTLSLDEFVIALFTAGTTTTTLPILIYSQIRTGVSPEINALGTILVLLSVIAVVIGARVFRRTETRT